MTQPKFITLTDAINGQKVSINPELIAGMWINTIKGYTQVSLGGMFVYVMESPETIQVLCDLCARI